MPKRVPLIACLVLLIQACSASVHAAEPLPEAEVLARVNGEVIVAGDLLWEVDLLLDQRLAAMPPEARASVPKAELAAAKRKMLEELLLSRLDMTLFYADFRSTVPQADLASIHANLEPQFINMELPNLMRRLEVESIPELRDKLRSVGTSLEERQRDFNRKMIARSWLTETVEYDKEVTHEQMLEYYREHYDEYAYESQARWEELMVRFDRYPTKRAAWAAICTLGNRAYQQVGKTPADEPALEAIARQGSQGVTASAGGQHDWTTQGSLAADKIDAALFTQPLGQLSPILEGPAGYHIVRVIERKEAGHEPFREVQAAIRDSIQNDRFSVAVQQRVFDLKRGARLWTAFTGDIDTSKVRQAGKAPTVR